MRQADKIVRIDVRDENDRLVLGNVNYELTGRFSKDTKEEIVIIKGSELPEYKRGTRVFLVVQYSYGERVCYPAHISLSTSLQWNVCLSPSFYKLKERRRYFKIAAELTVQVRACERGGEVQNYDPPLQMVTQDINLGGMYLVAPLGDKRVMQPKDVLSVVLYVEDEALDAQVEVLRVRNRTDSSMVVHGYGCRFLQLNAAQERILAAYINMCQLKML